jgi:hypothetical protein
MPSPSKVALLTSLIINNFEGEGEINYKGKEEKVKVMAKR